MVDPRPREQLGLDDHVSAHIMKTALGDYFYKEFEEYRINTFNAHANYLLETFLNPWVQKALSSG